MRCSSWLVSEPSPGPQPFRSSWATSEEQIHAVLWPAARQELLERSASGYRFVHDRVQEAAYSLVPDELRAEAHLRIGRLLAANIPPEEREEAIFEIVNQLNRGAPLITSPEEREQLAEFNLIAAKRAQTSTAYHVGARVPECRPCLAGQ